MEKSYEQLLRKIRNTIVYFTWIIGGVLWFLLPMKVAIHFDLMFRPDGYGSKFVMLLLFLFPLIAYIPMQLEEVHVDTEESNRKAIKRKNRSAFIQLLLAVLAALFVIGILLIAG